MTETYKPQKKKGPKRKISLTAIKDVAQKEGFEIKKTWSDKRTKTISLLAKIKNFYYWIHHEPRKGADIVFVRRLFKNDPDKSVRPNKEYTLEITSYFKDS